MKLKKVVTLIILLAVVVSGIFTVNLMTPKKTEAIPTTEFMTQLYCCIDYATTCPERVRVRCYSDCMAHGDCQTQN